MFIRKTRRRRRNVPTILETRTHSSYMLNEWPLIIHHCHMHAQSIVYPSYMVVLPGPTTHSYTPHTFTSYPKRPSFWLTICVCVCGNAVQRRRRTQLADGDALRIAPQRDLQHQAHSVCKQKRNIAHFNIAWSDLFSPSVSIASILDWSQPECNTYIFSLVLNHRLCFQFQSISE